MQIARMQNAEYCTAAVLEAGKATTAITTTALGISSSFPGDGGCTIEYYSVPQRTRNTRSNQRGHPISTYNIQVHMMRYNTSSSW